jgi:tRNA pseudouridine55 synthase
MARRNRNLKNITGILLLDKPAGLSSNAALQRVKHLFSARKAGHTGSLDPLATGMLPICLGEATKVSAFLLDADKRYRVSCKLGVTTSTADAEGEVVDTQPVPEIPDQKLHAVLDRFKGAIQQVPPMHSAIKHKGQRLYNLARQGIEVEREARTVTIHELVLLGKTADTLQFEVACSKGTYIRTLIEDIGKELGCGAHVTDLRRLTVGPFTDSSSMITLDQLEQLAENDAGALNDCLLPVDSALADWPSISLDRDSAWYLRQGQAVMVPQAPGSGMLRLYEDDNGFIGVGTVLADGRVTPKRLFKA